MLSANIFILACPFQRCLHVKKTAPRGRLVFSGEKHLLLLFFAPVVLYAGANSWLVLALAPRSRCGHGSLSTVTPSAAALAVVHNCSSYSQCWEVPTDRKRMLMDWKRAMSSARSNLQLRSRGRVERVRAPISCAAHSLSFNHQIAAPKKTPLQVSGFYKNYSFGSCVNIRWGRTILENCNRTLVKLCLISHLNRIVFLGNRRGEDPLLTLIY